MAAPAPYRLAARGAVAPGDGLDARVARLEAQMAQVLRVQAASVDHAVAVSQRLDPGRDERLLSAVAFARGARPFTARELRQCAASDPELRAALDGASVRRLGCWLRRLAGHDGAAGYRLVRVKRFNVGQAWAVTCV